jgi:purine-binding chemotaxis protein CheW
MSQQEKQFATFYLADRLYGINVMQVQEVTDSLPLTDIPLAPKYVKGLINLRGQLATAIGLRELLGIEDKPANHLGMAVVCRINTHLISLQVDKIGDVIRVADSDFELSPSTLDNTSRKFIQGVYKTEESILSVIEIDSIFAEINKSQK